MHVIGVVIPAYNEEEYITECLNSLQEFQSAGDVILVVDAASEDRTADLVKSKGVPLLHAASWARGYAIETGVKELLALRTDYDAILIIHADMVCQAGTREKLLEMLANHPHICGGALGHEIGQKGWRYRLLEWGNYIRACFFHMPYGDQAQFFCPKRLANPFSFPHQECLEDVELSLLMRKIAPLLYINYPVMISARHWKRGFLKTTLHNWYTVLHYIIVRFYSTRIQTKTGRGENSSSPVNSIEVDPRNDQGKMH